MKPIAIAALAATIASAAFAHDYKVGSIDINHPWTRATPKGASVAGGYLSITNKGTSQDRLVGGSLHGAGRLEIHEMKMEGGIMKMRPLPDGILIKPGETVELKPGGYHVMFMDLKGPIEQGKPIKGTLIFEKAGKVDIEYTVEAVGATPKPDHKGH
ncbi:MAG: copper chaperone PCu(A)C [Pseudorhodoplanes sp.]|nr:copper chaperone PCu(A)C [Pseudorhodoplanes sp.]